MGANGMTSRYSPDFPLLMRLCETNYAQLQPLLPHGTRVGAVQCYEVSGAIYQVAVRELTRYTSLAEITQIEAVVSHWRLPTMTVRLYHDARVAEVCASQQIFHFKARYDYPNKKLHQRDEKYQINQFLADWLRYCLVHGVMAISIY